MGCRSVGLEVGGVCRVVEHQQPVLAVLQLMQHEFDGIGSGQLRRQAEVRCERGELVGEQRGLLGVEPPHQGVVGGEAVGVLDGELSLADSAQAVQCLQHDSLVGGQECVELFEHAVSAGEVRVARRHLPHWRPHAREASDSGLAELGRGEGGGERVRLSSSGPAL
jgi:hypothetical protein